jgi:hypothetical protein
VSVDLVDPDEIEGDESTPGIGRKMLFETETNVMVRSLIDGGSTTGCHHHGDCHAYGYLERGHAVIGHSRIGLSVLGPDPSIPYAPDHLVNPSPCQRVPNRAWGIYIPKSD